MKLIITEISQGRGHDNQDHIGPVTHTFAKHEHEVYKGLQIFVRAHLDEGELVANAMVSVDDVKDDSIALSVYQWGFNARNVDLLKNRTIRTTLGLGQNVECDTYTAMDYSEKIRIELN